MANQPITRAIQVVTSQDELVSGEAKRVIKIVKQKRRGPTLEDILCNNRCKDLQILVFSIVGKTRGGKSLLLNLFIKYLESQPGTPDWLTGTVSPHTGFTWQGGVGSVTRGIWIWPKIYRRKAANGTEVGILLVDSEGMFDGEATDGEIIAISGLSTAISYIQMFNIKDKITTDYLESIVRNLMKGIEDMEIVQKECVRRDYKLMFLVRDWIYEDYHSFGLDEGRNYIEADSQRGSTEHKDIWEEIHRAFNEIQCVLLPYPGTAVSSTQFTNTGQLSDLDEPFLREVKNFISNLFASENLIPPETKLTGLGIYDLLMCVDGKIADDSLSFLNMFTEHANFDRMEKLLEEFRSRIRTKPDLPEVKSIMGEIERKGENEFKGNSRPQFKERLRKALEQLMNSAVIQKICESYRVEFLTPNSTRQYHDHIWPSIVNLLNQYICGDSSTRIKAKEKAVQITADIYYKKLAAEVNGAFNEKIRDSKELEDLAGLDYKIVKQHFQQCEDFSDIVDQTSGIYPIWLKYHHNLKCKVAKLLIEKIEALTGAKNLKNAKKKQYEHYEAFTLLKKNGDTWDSIAKSNPTLLCKKIGFALFGLPTPQLDNSDDTNRNNVSLVSTSGSYELKIVSLRNLRKQTDTNHLLEVKSGYSNEQDKQIASIGNVIISHSTGYEIKFSCAFVTFQEDSSKIEGIPKVMSVPVFRIQGDGSKIVYIDTNCRVYESWADFLSTNTLPDIVICYPLHGSYDIKTGFSVAFSRTPASSVTSKALKAADSAEKLISVGAGVAGVATLVVSAPIAAPCAIVGGAVAGVYGVGRCVMKIRDKKKHNEPYTKEVVKGVFNAIAVVAVGALRVAEGAVVVTTKIAQGICGLNGLVDLCYSDNAPKLNELLNELCDQSSMISFYFNAPSPSEAIVLIKKALGINEKAGDVEVLETLVKMKSIEYSVDEEDVTKLQKRVSENITELVISLLNTINPTVKDLVVLLTGINQDFQSLKDTRRTNVFDKIESKLSKLLGKLLIENKDIRRIFLDLACRSSYNNSLNSRVTEQFLSKITNEINEHLLLRLRDLIWSVLSKVRKVNHYCNNISHLPDSLISYDVKCHPVEEVNRKIRDKVEQNQSTNELHSEIVLKFDDFLQQTLEFLLKNAQPYWTLTQYTKCLSLITQDITKMFDEEIKKLETIVHKKKNPTCNDLSDIFQQIGIKGNYGKELLKNVLDCYEVDQRWNTEEVESQPLTRVPAWSGMVDNLYCYCSNQQIQPEDILEVYRTNRHVYIKEESTSGKLVCLRPSDDDLPLPTFMIYSLTNHQDMKHGLVWVSPSQSTN